MKMVDSRVISYLLMWPLLRSADVPRVYDNVLDVSRRWSGHEDDVQTQILHSQPLQVFLTTISGVDSESVVEISRDDETIKIQVAAITYTSKGPICIV